MEGLENSIDELDGETSPLLGSRVIPNHLSQDVQDAAYFNNNRPRSVIGVPSTVLEPPNVYRSRWRSIRIMYLTMFLGAVTFTITMSSLWPFLKVLDTNANASFLGWVVAAYSLGQLAASPTFGLWATKRKSSREPLIVSLALTTLSNLFYMYLQTLPSHKNYFMILARGFIGFSAGNVAVVRSYASGATTLKERTSCMANVSIFQAMGFILGPVIQAAMVPIGYPGPVEKPGFHFNMYTAPAFFATSLAVINLVLLITVFKEHRVDDDETTAGHIQENADMQGGIDENSEKELKGIGHSMSLTSYKLDYIAVFSSIYIFFVVLFMFTVFETIGTPLTMHMYAWNKSKATLYQGILLGSGGILSVVVFMVVKVLAKKYNERYLLLIGFIFCLCGYFIFIPWGDVLPPRGFAPIFNASKPTSGEVLFTLSDQMLPESTLYDNRTHIVSNQISRSVPNFTAPVDLSSVKNSGKYDSDTNLLNVIATSTETTKPTSMVSSTTDNPISSTTTSDYRNTTHPGHNTTVGPEGCPWTYKWCSYVPVIYFAQYICGIMLISIGYPMCNLLSYTIYSKVLGPQPQGLWMGWLTASGSLARTVGPVYVSQVYDSYGPQITFGSCCVYIFSTIVFIFLAFRRLVQFSFKDDPLLQFGGPNRKR